MTKPALFLLLVAACGGRDKSSAPDKTASHDPWDGQIVIDAPIVDALAAVDTRHWFAGDVHMHVSPPDDPADVTYSVQKIAEAAAQAGMDFVVLTPHLWQGRWEGSEFKKSWTKLAADAAAIAKPTMIPGVEWGDRDGHFTVTGVDIAKLPAKQKFLDAAHDAGAFISTNHPFAVPTNIPFVRASHFDMSYRPWSERAKGFTQIDGAEVWNIPLGFANVLSRPGGKTGEERAWIELDRVVHEEHRRVTAVAGTDNHKTNVMATTWVLAADATSAAIVDALKSGATCIGGLEAASFRARGLALASRGGGTAGGNTQGKWVRIGDGVAGANVELAWEGVARLFVDGKDRGEFDGGFTHETGGELHTYRIAKGASRCGFIYANLPGA